MLIGSVFAGNVICFLMLGVMGVLQKSVALFCCLFWGVLIIGCAWAFRHTKGD